MKILFQGDSITDAGRAKGDIKNYGQGYPLLIAADLRAQKPGAYELINLGISGNRVVDVYARIKADCWNHAPDVLSLLIGINDVWHEVAPVHNGVDAERFERVLRMLLEDTKERLPDIRFILMEPFVLKASATEEQWEFFYEETVARARIVEKLAAEYGCVYVPLQKMFDDACALAPADYWLGDGVHPTPAGHRLIADAWEAAFHREIVK